MTKVAVVGAGPLGLLALKNLKEDGFDVTGYDARPFVGGIWNNSDDDFLSVQESTVFNTSSFRAAFTDFPFPEDASDFPTWREMQKYINDYCDHFDLNSHIKLNTKATNLRRQADRWALEVLEKESGPRVDYFDKIVIACGSFVTPKIPKIGGMERLEGTAIHAFDFHRPEQYKDKKILLIGLHATTQDVAKSLSKYATKIYCSHRSGLTLFPRYNPDHSTFDVTQTLNFFFFHTVMDRWFPNLFTWIIDKAITRVSKKAFPKIPAKWNFSPAPSIAITPPLVNDEMYNLMESGFAEPCGQVSRVTGPKTVELTDGTFLTDIDAIIYCTGYDMAVPFLPPEFNPYPVLGEPPVLYRNIFSMHPDPAVRNSLAILGQAALPFPGFAQHELIAMAVSQIFQGKTLLPSLPEMQAWRKRYLAWRRDLVSRQKVKSTFYVVFMPTAEHLTWLDKVAGTGLFENFGWCSWRAWRFWWRDRELYRKCKSGLFSPAIWRLFDMGGRKPWDGARSQIFRDNERMIRRMEERRVLMERKEKDRKG